MNGERRPPLPPSCLGRPAASRRLTQARSVRWGLFRGGSASQTRSPASAVLGRVGGDGAISACVLPRRDSETTATTRRDNEHDDERFHLWSPPGKRPAPTRFPASRRHNGVGGGPGEVLGALGGRGAHREGRTAPFSRGRWVRWKIGAGRRCRRWYCEGYSPKTGANQPKPPLRPRPKGVKSAPKRRFALATTRWSWRRRIVSSSEEGRSPIFRRRGWFWKRGARRRRFPAAA
jgi:hypothetical protein